MELVKVTIGKFFLIYPIIALLITSCFQAYTFKNQIVITSDTLFMHFLSKDLMQGGSLSDWNLTQAPDYFPHMFLYVVISLLTHDAALQLLLITIAQTFTLSVLFYSLFRLVGQTQFISLLEAIGLLTLINLFQLHSQEWIYFYKTNNHFSSVLLGLLCLTLLLRANRSDGFRSLSLHLILFSLVFLGTLSTLTFVYSITIPMALVTGAKFFSRSYSHGSSIFSRELFFFAGSLWISTILALFITIRTNSGSSLKNRVGFSNPDFTFVQDLLMKAFSRNMIHSGTIVRTIFLFGIVGVLLFVLFFILCDMSRFNKSIGNEAFGFLVRFSLLSLLASCILTILSGGMVDEFFLRYFWPSIFLCGISTTFFVTEILRRYQRPSLQGKHIETLVVVLLLVLFFLSGKPIYNGTSPYKSTAECILDLQNNGVKLENGVADYWYGRGVDYFSTGVDQTFISLNSLEPFFWMNSLDNIESESYYNYILLHTNPEPFDFNFDSMAGLLPVPTQKFNCPETDIQIYFYDNNSLDRIIQVSKLNYLISLN